MRIRRIFRCEKLFLLALLVTACSTDDVINEVENNEINEVLESLKEFNQPDESGEVEVGMSDPMRDDDDQSLECVTTTYSMATGFDEMVALDPSTDVIFPGAILKGETIPTGAYEPIISDRNAVTLSASLTNISGSPVVTVNNPTLSSVREGIKTILDQEVTGGTAARVSFEISNVYSEEQLNIAIGANYRVANKSVSGSFDFSNSTYSNRFVVKFIQTYYTIDVDPPANPGDFFAKAPDASVFGSTCPVYVGTVAYGRMVIYTVETNRTQTEIDAAFRATINSADGEVETNYENIITESKINAVIIGGSAADAVGVIEGPQGIYKYISQGGNYDRNNPGAPIAYKLRYLKKGTPVARVVLQSEYPIRNCDVAYQKYFASINAIEVKDFDAGFVNSWDTYGKIKIEYFDGNQSLGSKEWSVSRDNAIKLNENSRYTINGKNFTVADLYKLDTENVYARITADIYRKDLVNDNHLGGIDEKIYVSNINVGSGERSRTMQDKGKVKIYFTLKEVAY